MTQKQLAYYFSLFLIACWGCHSSKAVTSTTPPEQVVPTEKSLLWRISGNGLKKPSYLFGTIHMIPKDKLKLSNATVSALESCERIAFEIDMKEMTSIGTQFSLLTKAFMKDDKTLKDLLSPEDYAFVKAKMDAKGMGMSMFERIKPMFLSMILGQDESTGGGNPMGGDAGNTTAVELELYKIAKAEKIKSAGLETAEYQMSVFDKIPYEDQAKMLLQSLRTESDNKGEDQFEQMVSMYLSQDIEAMQSMIATDSSGMSNYEDILLNNRNSNWITPMGNFMKTQPTFFAVGAGHLAGPGGVIALLRKAGYKVEAIR